MKYLSRTEYRQEFRQRTYFESNNLMQFIIQMYLLLADCWTPILDRVVSLRFIIQSLGIGDVYKDIFGVISILVVF